MMRNLFKVLLVSSALVAVTAPSAYAIPEQEAAAAVNNPAGLAATITSANFAGLSAAASACAATANPGLCLTNILAAYAQLNVLPTRAQLDDLVALSGASFTPEQLADFQIAAVTTTPTTNLPGVDSGVGAGSNGGISTGASPSAQ